MPYKMYRPENNSVAPALKNKHGGYHKGQVNDAEVEEMNDNIAMGKGPAKPKSIVSARPKTSVKLNPDSDDIALSLPTAADVIDEEKNKQKDPDTKRAKKVNKKLLVNRPEPTYEGTDEFRNKKNISKSERKKRGV